MQHTFTEEELTEVIKNNNIIIVDAILKQGKVNPCNALSQAISSNNIGIIILLLSDNRIRSRNKNNNNSAFIKAVLLGHTGIVKRFLDSDLVDPAVEANQAIKSAAAAGHTEIVELLLADHQVDPAVDNNAPLRAAIMQSNIDVARLLINDLRVTPDADLAQDFKQLEKKKTEKDKSKDTVKSKDNDKGKDNKDKDKDINKNQAIKKDESELRKNILLDLRNDLKRLREGEKSGDEIKIAAYSMLIANIEEDTEEDLFQIFNRAKDIPLTNKFETKTAVWRDNEKGINADDEKVIMYKGEPGSLISS